MNFHFADNRKSEREFQQLVAWENNRSAIANDTEYFITDVEFADVEQGTRLDMLGLKWLSKDRKFNDRCKTCFHRDEVRHQRLRWQLGDKEPH